MAPSMPAYTLPHIDWSVVMPTLLVMLTGILALAIEMFRPKQNNNLIVGVSVAGLIGTVILLVGQLGQPEASTFFGQVYRDQFGIIVQLLIVIGTIICFLFSEPYLREKRVAFGEFYPMAMWAASGGMMIVGTQSLLMMFVGLEVLSISLYCLAGMARQEPKSEESALKYFLLGSFASAFFLYGIAFAYGSSGSINLDAFRQVASGGDLRAMSIFAVALMIVGMGFKSALAPFHQWTPDVYQGAPTNVTAFMAVVSKAAAIGALFRVLQAAMPYSSTWMPVLGVIAVVTMTVGNLSALTQKDVKRALGYSSIAHAGYMLVGLLAHLNAPDQVTLGPLLFYLFAYGFVTIGAFAIVTLVAKGGKESTNTQDLKGLWKREPFAAVAMLIFMVSLIGMPPTAGFIGKLYLFQAAWGSGFEYLAWALAINSVISIYYYGRIAAAGFGEDSTALTPQLAPMKGGLRLACILCIIAALGLWLTPLYRYSSERTPVAQVSVEGDY